MFTDDERMTVLAQTLEAFFNKDILLQEVEEYSSVFNLTRDPKVRKKKKYYTKEGDDYIEVTTSENDVPVERGWYEKDHITRREVDAELHRLTCHHPHCRETYPCRAAIRRSGGTMCCTALTNTEFIGYACPFFQTKEDYEEEFWRTYTAEKPIITKRRKLEKIVIKEGARK